MSITTAGLAPAAFEPLVDDVQLAVLSSTPGATASWTFDGGVLEVRSDGDLDIRMSVPLGDAVGFWHPDCGWQRTVVADWAGWAHASLVRGAVAGCLYDSRGESMLAFLAEDSVPETWMRFGVSEENKTFVVQLMVTAGAFSQVPYRLLFTERIGSVAAVMRGLSRRLNVRGLPPVPASARVPAYSTWYGFSQDVTAAGVEAEAVLATELGCGMVILDDGWQRLGHGRGYAGVGDWVPDTGKFPDLRAHVERVRGLGLAYLLWIAPLLVGPNADCFAELVEYAPETGGPPGARVLDPRHPEVRAHVVRVCSRLMADYGLDGLKIDFLDVAMTYAGRPGAGADVTDVGVAMRLLLSELRAALGPDALIELRQPYVGPGMAEFGELLRAGDCPADAIANRVRTIDIGLLAVRGAVHSDMLMWDENGDLRSAARQFIGAFHAVPQVSARLTRLDDEQRRMVGFWLGQWQRLRPLLLDGEVEPGRPDELYPVVVASDDGQCVVTVTADRVVPLDVSRHRRVTLINGTASERLVLEVSGAGVAMRKVVYNAGGLVMDSSEHRLDPGLHLLDVPPSGLAILEGAT